MTKFFALLASVALFAACTESSKDEEKPQPKPTPEPSGAITLSADKTTIELGESVTFKVTMKNAETGETTDITAEASLYDSNLDKVGLSYKTYTKKTPSNISMSNIEKALHGAKKWNEWRDNLVKLYPSKKDDINGVFKIWEE